MDRVGHYQIGEGTLLHLLLLFTAVLVLCVTKSCCYCCTLCVARPRGSCSRQHALRLAKVYSCIADARSNAHPRTGNKRRLRWFIPHSCCLYCCSAHAAALVVLLRCIDRPEGRCNSCFSRHCLLCASLSEPVHRSIAQATRAHCTGEKS